MTANEGDDFEFLRSFIGTVRTDAAEALARIEARLKEAEGDFIGPCAHDRDPYTRCEDGCEPLIPSRAEIVALRAQLDAAREALRKIVTLVEDRHQDEDDAWGMLNEVEQTARAALGPIEKPKG
jgi:hypothetical protein